MIFKNVLRTIQQKPLQFFLLMILIMMSSFTYVSLETAISSVSYFLDDYASKTNQEDFLVVLSSPTEQAIRSMIAQKGVSVSELANLSKSEMMKQYEYSLVDYYEDKVAALGERFNATIEGRFYRDVVQETDDGTYTYRVVKQTDSVNSTYVVAGKMPESSSEIAVFKQYADANDLALGDSVKMNDAEYQISAFIAVPDYIYPVFSYDNPLYEADRETIAVVTDDVYDTLSQKQWVLYSGYFNDDVDVEEEVEKMAGISGVSHVLSKNQNVRISTVSGELIGNKLLSATFSSLLLVMCVVVIVLILKKRINADRMQIGVLKAMGYSRLTISLNYLTYPLIAALFGTVIGSLFGIGVSGYISSSYMVHYVVPKISTYFTPQILLGGIVYPILMVAVSSFIILLFLLREAPLDLMQESSHLKLSRTSKILAKLLSPLSFETRFKYSLAFRNMGKILSLFIIVFVASIFLVFASIVFKSVENIVDKAFGSVNYNYQVKYSKLINEPLGITESPFIEYNAMPLSMKNSEGEVMFDVTTSFVVYGIDSYNIINPLYNAAGENITRKSQQGLIINEFIARAYSLEIGDVLTFEAKNKQISYEVVDVVDHYNGPMMYVDMNLLADDLHLVEGYYNGKWTGDRPSTEENISYIFSINDLERNIEIGMEMIQVSLSIMLIISVVLGSIIMILITNFIIDENQKQISILKVMGYTKKEVSKMVLTIYLPFVIVAYLISIPVTRGTIDYIMNQIAASLPMAIPTDFTMIQAISGLFIILFTYFIAMGCSKAQLDRISLHEVLKY